MKIVIDIPEEDYVGICHLTNEQLRILPEEVAETLIRIANGTPLNTIRAEIEQRRDEWIKGQDAEWHTYDRCLAIIDKYTKGDTDV